MYCKTYWLAIAAPLTLAACMDAAECTGDPRFDELGQAAGCTFGGGYQQETDRLAAEAESRGALAAELRAENARLNTQLDALNAQERALTQRLVNVNNSMASLETQLANRLAREEIGQAEYDIGVAELESLNAQRRNVQPSDPQAEQRIAELESQISDLRAFLG